MNSQESSHFNPALEPGGRFELEINSPARKRYYAVPPESYYPHPNAEDDLNYATHSVKSISEDFERSFATVLDKGWIHEKGTVWGEGDSELAVRLHDLVERALFDSHTMRLQRNSRLPARDILHPDDTAASLVLSGLASPYVCFDVIKRYPELVSLEGAKDSHPLMYSGSDEMNMDVAEALVAQGFIGQEEAPIYKRYGRMVDNDIPAVIIERKQVLGYIRSGDRKVLISQRRRLIARGDEYAKGYDEGLDRKIKNIDRFGDLAGKIHGCINYATDDIDYFRWLQPISTSYYAYYPDLVEPKLLTRPIEEDEQEAPDVLWIPDI